MGADNNRRTLARWQMQKSLQSEAVGNEADWFNDRWLCGHPYFPYVIYY
jgi:hypothetical protein